MFRLLCLFFPCILIECSFHISDGSYLPDENDLISVGVEQSELLSNRFMFEIQHW